MNSPLALGPDSTSFGLRQYKCEYYDDNGEIKHMSAFIHGRWNVVYSWPAPATLLKVPTVFHMDKPSKLQAMMFTCRCSEDNVDRFAPVVMSKNDGAKEVYACQIVNTEADADIALTITNCFCQKLPLHTKFVILPINEDYLLYYIKEEGVTYSNEQPSTTYLLHKDIPCEDELKYILEDLEVRKREGGVTYNTSALSK